MNEKIKRKAHVKQSFSLDFLERGTFTEYPIVSSLEKARIKDYIGVELTMNSIKKDSILCNPGILGSGILATNVSQTSKDIILDYSNKLVDIYKDAKYKDYDGSLYIQHL